jgi:hypothetical protein
MRLAMLMAVSATLRAASPPHSSISVLECHPPSLERLIPELAALLALIAVAKSSSRDSALLISPKPTGVSKRESGCALTFIA